MSLQEVNRKNLPTFSYKTKRWSSVVVTTHTSSVQINRHFIGLCSGPGVVPASVRVLSPCLGVTSVQALIVHGGGVHPKPVADDGHAVDAHLAAAAVAVDLYNAIVHEHGYHCWFRFRGGLGRRTVSWFRDWYWPPQPLDLHLGGTCGRHGSVADQGDGVASF